MHGPGKYIFNLGCEQHGEYIPIVQVPTKFVILHSWNFQILKIPNPKNSFILKNF